VSGKRLPKWRTTRNCKEAANTRPSNSRDNLGIDINSRNTMPIFIPISKIIFILYVVALLIFVAGMVVATT